MWSTWRCGPVRVRRAVRWGWVLEEARRSSRVPGSVMRCPSRPVKEARSAGTVTDGEASGLTGVEGEAGVADEALQGLDDGGDGVVEVELDGFGAGAPAGVADGEGEGEGAVGGCFVVVDGQVGPVEGGVGEAVSEGEGGGGVDVGHVVGVGEAWAEVGGGLGSGCAGDADGEAPGGVEASGEDSGDGVGAFFAGEEGLDDGGGFVGGAAQCVGAAGEQDGDEWGAGVEEGVEEVLLSAGQGQ